MKIKDCGNCKHYEQIDTFHYTCKNLKSKQTIFQTDSTDTAEVCKHFSGELTEVKFKLKR